MKFLLTHFNTNLRNADGCLVCVVDSQKRLENMPDKTSKLDAQQTISDEFSKLE